MVVLVLDNDWQQSSLQLARRFHFQTVSEPVWDYYFVIENGILKVRNPRWGPRFVIELDLQKEVDRIRNQKRSFKKDLLCRSLGYKGEKDFRVIDGSLGLAKDALHLVSFGIHVLGCEINPAPFCLVEEALNRCQLQKFLEIQPVDSLQWIRQSSEKFHSLYLDPMFEDIKTKSAPKKNMAFLRDRTKGVFGVREIVFQALEKGVRRVVIKRPLRGKYLCGKPNFMYKGRLVRYDVYTHAI